MSKKVTFLVVAAFLGALLPTSSAWASTGATLLVSRYSDGSQIRDGHVYRPDVSDDGRFVTMTRSEPEGKGPANVLLLRDRQLGTTTELGFAEFPRLSGDGRWVLGSYQADAILWNVSTGASTTVFDGDWINGPSGFGMDISADGRYVLISKPHSSPFSSRGLFRLDRDPDENGTFDESGLTSTELVSVDTSGNPVSFSGGSISDDGAFVVFNTQQFPSQVLLRDIQDGNTEVVSLNSEEDAANGPSSEGVISGDGTHVAFTSSATNLSPSDTNSSADVYLRNVVTGTTQVLSARAEPNDSIRIGDINDTGSAVAFSTYDSLAPADWNQWEDVYLWTQGSAELEIVSQSSTGEVDNAQPPDEEAEMGKSGIMGVALSGDGRYVAFSSSAENLVPNYTKPCHVPFEFGDPSLTPCPQVFVRDRQATFQEVSSGGTASTGSTASEADPYVASITLPSGASGQVTISETPVSPDLDDPEGYEFLGSSFEFEGVAPAMWNNPIRLEFKIDASEAPDPAATMTRNGVVVADCLGSTTALPPADPGSAQPGDGAACLATRETLTSGDLRLVVLTPRTSYYIAVVPDTPDDTTPPTITITGNAGTYKVDEQVNISCVATDTSGIATDGCVSPNAPAYTFGLGAESISVSATDNAGNQATDTIAFTVTVDHGSLCRLTKQFLADDGSEGARLGKTLCSQLESARTATTNKARTKALSDYKALVASKTPRIFTQSEASTLTNLANAL